jgi:hypothetical protein
MKRLLALSVAAVAFTAAGATGALAGEVIGPPGTQADHSAPGYGHAASLCSASGLNDNVVGEGQTDFQVQNFGIDVSGKTSETADPHEFNPGTGCNPTAGG